MRCGRRCSAAAPCWRATSPASLRSRRRWRFSCRRWPPPSSASCCTRGRPRRGRTLPRRTLMVNPRRLRCPPRSRRRLRWAWGRRSRPARRDRRGASRCASRRARFRSPPLRASGRRSCSGRRWRTSACAARRWTTPRSRSRWTSRRATHSARALAAIGAVLEAEYQSPQDVEGTVVGEQVYIVQTRPQPL